MVRRSWGVVFTGVREVALEEIEVADPGPGQALVRMTRSLVSAGTEISTLLGQSARVGWPARPGYSAVGIVEAVGEGVREVSPGQRVLTRARHAGYALIDLEDVSASPAGGDTRLRPLAAPHYLQPIPDGVSDEQAVFAVLGSVALHGVRKAGIQLGEACAVVGQGVVGQLLVQLARANGAWPVIAIDTVASRLERSKEGGADAVVDPSDGDVERAVLELTGGRGAEVCFEATRSPQAFPSALAVAALNGRVVLVGSIHAPAEVELFEGIQRKELTIVGAWQPRAPLEPAAYYQWSQHRNREVFMELTRRGAVRVDHLISHRARGEEIPRLYEEMATAPGEWLGVLFDWTA